MLHRCRVDGGCLWASHPGTEGGSGCSGPSAAAMSRADRRHPPLTPGRAAVPPPAAALAYLTPLTPVAGRLLADDAQALPHVAGRGGLLVEAAVGQRERERGLGAGVFALVGAPFRPGGEQLGGPGSEVGAGDALLGDEPAERV